MTIANLIPLTVDRLTDPDLYWDETLKGFGLNVRRDARGNIQRSFIIQYRIGKQQRKLKLGDAAKLNAKQARKKAEELFAQITLGQDPQGEKKVERAAPTLTLRAALEKYCEMKEAEVKQGTYRPSSLARTRLYLLGAQYFGPLHKVGINAITRQAVAARLHEIRQASSDITAGRARAQLSAAFTRLMQEGLAEMNPCIGTKGQTDRPQRDRVLSGDELRAVWNACDLNTDFGRIVRLLILTGCRREEIGGLIWSEVDLDAGTISLPAERTKNGRAHTLTLPKMAMDILAPVPRMVDRVHLFGVRSIGFRSWQTAMARFEPDGVKPWKLHDLRRTVATGMAEIGIEPHIIEAVLNHASGHKAGVAGIYNRASYAKQMKTALIRWAEHVDAIVSGRENKVVTLRVS
jgi:integrase